MRQEQHACALALQPREAGTGLCREVPITGHISPRSLTTEIAGQITAWLFCRFLATKICFSQFRTVNACTDVRPLETLTGHSQEFCKLPKTLSVSILIVRSSES